MQIDKWEERLGRHFGELARLREGAARPVFGLEHGLASDELRDLKESAREDLRQTGCILEFPLTWVV